MLRALVTVLAVLLVPSTALPSYISYNFSSNIFQEFHPMLNTRGFSHFVPLHDLSGPLWSVKALNNTITIQPGLAFNITPLPKDSGFFEQLKANYLLSYDSVEFTSDSDYDDEFTPKILRDDNGGFLGIDIFGDGGYDRDHQKSHYDLKKKSSIGRNTKTFEGKLIAVKRDYRNEEYVHVDLNDMDGLLFQVRNATININSTLEISKKIYHVAVKLWDIDMNKTVHLDVKDLSVKLVSTVCSLKSRMDVTIYDSDSNIESLRQKIDFQKILLNEMCKALGKYTMTLFKKIGPPNKMVYKLYEGLYFDMRVSKLVLTEEKFGVGHVAEYIFKPEMIKKLPTNPNTILERSFSAAKASYMSKTMKFVQEDFLSSNQDYLCKEMINSTVDKIVTKEYVIIDKGAGPGEKSKVGEDKTKGDYDMKLRVDEEMLNTFGEGLITNNLTNERITQLDLNDGCTNVTLIRPICEAFTKCSKESRASRDNFTASIKQLRNDDGRYFSFKDDAVHLNTTHVISLNDKSVKVTNLVKLKTGFNDHTCFSDLISMRFIVTASDKFHSFLDPFVKTLRTKLSTNSSVSYTFNLGVRVFSSLRDGSLNLAVKLKK